MTQDQALSILKSGANVFLTGAPGAGKTYVLNRYVGFLEACGIPVAVTASTGIAATHIHGMTIHSWSGIGIKNFLSARDLDDIAANEKASKRVRGAKVLVIDEISMLDGRVLDAVDQATRALRRDTSPFGGLQVVLVGDFFQLPPIAKNGETARFAFESSAWEALAPICCYLTEQHRQEDQTLLSMLSAIRENTAEEAYFEPLFERVGAVLEEVREPTKLYTHNIDVDRINAEKLSSLATAGRVFAMTGKGNRALREALVRNCLSPEALTLKEGAVVICTKNNFEEGFVNGTLGVVKEFDADSGYPVIETLSGKTIAIEPMDWTIEENGKPLASITQIPLRLAWAITVHKSQGMTLDAAVIDLSKTFEFGQGYVALSRVRSLTGLSLIGINGRAFMVHPTVIEKDGELRELSFAAEESFARIDEAALHKMHEQFVRALGGTMPRPGAAAPARRMAKETPPKPNSKLLTLTLLREGKTLAEIARERQLVSTTIVGHLRRLHEEEALRESDAASIVKAATLSPEDIAAIEEAFARLATDRLTPIFEHFRKRYSFDQLALARIAHRLNHPPSKEEKVFS